jgi:hypothetical protein
VPGSAEVPGTAPMAPPQACRPRPCPSPSP